jgi:hypothetical protein
MKEQTATATRTIRAPADTIYQIIADYRNGHPRMLPKQYFLHLHVEDGGYGAGTVINFSMRLLGQTQQFRSVISEPDPGHLLVETDLKSQMPTTFQAVPKGQFSRVTISTILTGRSWLETTLAKPLLQKIYRAELDLLAGLVEGQPG